MAKQKITFADKTEGGAATHLNYNEIKSVVNNNADELDSKVSADGDKVLSDNNYSDTDAAKVAALSGSNTGDETALSIVTKIGDGSKISSTYLPGYVDDVIEVANYAALPEAGEQGKIYITLDTNHEYRWSGSLYVDLTTSISFASQAEAEAGAENTKVMTSLRVLQSVIYQMANYVFSGLTTTAKTIIGAINELNSTTGATLTPSAISLAKKSGTSYTTYQQTGVLSLVATDTTAVTGGVAEFKIIKTADAITVMYGTTDITTIGKFPGSDDFSTTVGDIDKVVIWSEETDTNNTTGVYYIVKNLG